MRKPAFLHMRKQRRRSTARLMWSSITPVQITSHRGLQHIVFRSVCFCEIFVCIHFAISLSVTIKVQYSQTCLKRPPKIDKNDGLKDRW